MRVLLVHPALYVGGAERVVVGLLEGLVRRGWDARLLTLSVAPGLLEPLGVPMDRIIVPSSLTGGQLLGMDYRDPGLLVRAARDVRALAMALRGLSEQFDVVNPHNFPASAAVGLARVRRPVVWHCNEPYPMVLKSFNRIDRSQILAARMLSDLLTPWDTLLVRSWIGSIVVLDEFNQRRVRSFYRRDSVIVPTPVDSERYEHGEGGMVRDRHGLGDRFVMLHVGWLNRMKNQNVSIAALRLVRNEIPDACLVLVGVGETEGELRRQARELGVDDSVVFAGRVPDDELTNYYHACDVNLFPNRTQSWGLAPLEALAAGKVSVVSDEAGVSEILGRRAAAVVVPPRPEEIARAVLALHRGELDGQAMLREGRRLLREELSWPVYVERIAAIFEAAAGQAGRS